MENYKCRIREVKYKNNTDFYPEICDPKMLIYEFLNTWAMISKEARVNIEEAQMDLENWKKKNTIIETIIHENK